MDKDIYQVLEFQYRATINEIRQPNLGLSRDCDPDIKTCIDLLSIGLLLDDSDDDDSDDDDSDEDDNDEDRRQTVTDRVSGGNDVRGACGGAGWSNDNIDDKSSTFHSHRPADRNNSSIRTTVTPPNVTQDPPIFKDVLVSLEDILTGTMKKFVITREIMNSAGRVTKTEEETCEINIKAGWKAGTKITFHKVGDRKPDVIPADVVFVIKDKPHEKFTRDGNDIRYTAKIALKDALCGGTMNIPTLSGGKVPLQITGVVNPNTVKRIGGQGLPYPKNPSKRGDLIVDFIVRFPEQVSESQKQKFEDCLSSKSQKF